MRLLTIKQFAKECGLTYEAIRMQIGNKIIPQSTNPILIDAEKYSYILDYKKHNNIYKYSQKSAKVNKKTTTKK